VQLADYLNSQEITLEGINIRETDFRAKKNICKQVFQNVANRFYQNTKRSPSKVHIDSSNDSIDSSSHTSESLHRDCLSPENISSHKCNSQGTRVMSCIIVLKGLIIIYLYCRNSQLEARLNDGIFERMSNGIVQFVITYILR